jgi:hypothetical protein
MRRVKLIGIILVLIIILTLFFSFGVNATISKTIKDNAEKDVVNTQMNPQSTIDQFHEVNEGQYLTFTEKQDSWGVTWSYITTDSQPPTPQFLGIPPGVNNLGVPNGATMPTVFGYLKTDNYLSNGTDLGCILNCNITSKFEWTPSYCSGIQMNYTFYNTSSNTTRKYNYHFNLLKWRSDLPFPGVPIDTIIEKIRVNNVNRPPQFNSQLTNRFVAVNSSIHMDIIATDPDKTECGDDNITVNWSASVGTFTDHGNGDIDFDWTPSLEDLGNHSLAFTVTDKYNSSQQKNITINVYQPAPPCKPVYNKYTNTWSNCNQE